MSARAGLALFAGSAAGLALFVQARRSIPRGGGVLSGLWELFSTTLLAPPPPPPIIHDLVSAEACIAELESIVQRDEGKRGIGQLVLPRGELFNAAQAMLDSRHVGIISGFPCLLMHEPPTETDGPLGALAIARALVTLGKTVTILTDECNEEVFLACGAASGLHHAASSGQLSFQSFPGGAAFQEADSVRLQTLGAGLDLVVAIERTGPSASGAYLTMRGLDMTAIVAPLDDLLQPPLPEDSDDGYADASSGSGDGHIKTLSSLNNSSSTSTSNSNSNNNSNKSTPPARKPPTSIGIGDGGNEVGMGKIYHTVAGSTIPNAALIACVVPTTHLLVASVSNWGGYALAAAAAVLASARAGAPAFALVSACLPSAAQEQTMCERIVASGARDGVSGLGECAVDGMPLAVSLAVLAELRRAALAPR